MATAWSSCMESQIGTGTGTFLFADKAQPECFLIRSSTSLSRRLMLGMAFLFMVNAG